MKKGIFKRFTALAMAFITLLTCFAVTASAASFGIGNKYYVGESQTYTYTMGWFTTSKNITIKAVCWEQLDKESIQRGKDATTFSVTVTWKDKNKVKHTKTYTKGYDETIKLSCSKKWYQSQDFTITVSGKCTDEMVAPVMMFYLKK